MTLSRFSNLPSVLVLTSALFLALGSDAFAQTESPSSLTRTISLTDLAGRPGKFELRLGAITVIDFEKKIRSAKSGNAAMFESSIEGSRIFIRFRSGSGEKADLVVIFEDNEVALFDLALVKGEGSSLRYFVQNAPLKVKAPVVTSVPPVTKYLPHEF